MVTTHFQDEAEDCDRVVLVYHGRLIAEGSPDDLKDRARTQQWNNVVFIFHSLPAKILSVLAESSPPAA